MKFLKALIVVFSCTGFLFAQAEGTDAGQKDSVMIIHGKVVLVDLIAKTIIVKTRRTIDTLNVGSGAKIMLGRMELSKEIDLVDLHNDTKVNVTWKLIDNKKTATKIVLESVADSKKEIGTNADMEY
jgi:hypothetical protein